MNLWQDSPEIWELDHSQRCYVNSVLLDGASNYLLSSSTTMTYCTIFWTFPMRVCTASWRTHGTSSSHAESLTVQILLDSMGLIMRFVNIQFGPFLLWRRLDALREGSFYTSAQQSKYDNLNSGLCCGVPDTAAHRCLSCNALRHVHDRHPEALQLWHEVPHCVREHLLPPRNPLFRQVKSLLHALPITGEYFEFLANPGEEVHIFTDGSCSIEPLPDLRLAGWSVISATHGRPICCDALAGMPQTINRAELTAVVTAAQWVRKCGATGFVWTDSAYVARGTWRLQADPSDSPGSNQDLWRLLRHELDELPARLFVRHIPGHQDPTQCDDPVASWRLTLRLKPPTITAPLTSRPCGMLSLQPNTTWKPLWVNFRGCTWILQKQPNAVNPLEMKMRMTPGLLKWAPLYTEPSHAQIGTDST